MLPSVGDKNAFAGISLVLSQSNFHLVVDEVVDDLANSAVSEWTCGGEADSINARLYVVQDAVELRLKQKRVHSKFIAKHA